MGKKPSNSHDLTSYNELYKQLLKTMTKRPLTTEIGPFLNCRKLYLKTDINVKNVLKSDLKKSLVCPILGLFLSLYNVKVL